MVGGFFHFHPLVFISYWQKGLVGTLLFFWRKHSFQSVFLLNCKPRQQHRTSGLLRRNFLILYSSLRQPLSRLNWTKLELLLFVSLPTLIPNLDVRWDLAQHSQAIAQVNMSSRNNYFCPHPSLWQSLFNPLPNEVLGFLSFPKAEHNQIPNHRFRLRQPKVSNYQPDEKLLRE